MASEEIALVLSHRPDSNHSQFLFQDDSNLAFRRNPPQHHQRHPSSHHPANHSKTTRELTGFIGHHYQPQATTEFRNAPPAFHHGIQVWASRNERDSSSPSGVGSDSDDDDEDDKMIDQDGDDDVVGLVSSSDDFKNAHRSNVFRHINGEKNGNGKRNHFSSIGSSNEVLKEGIVMLSGNDINDLRASPNDNNQQGQLCQYQNAITIADPSGDLYYSQYLRGVEGSVAGLKDAVVENGQGFGGRKDASNSGGSRESLKAILSDPLTGALMDDAMILTCGHSFGSSGMQHVMRMKACYTCSHPVSEGSVASNLSLQSAVLAFRREEELQTHCASKRRNRLEQEKSNCGDLALVDQSKCRGVQFPFFVSDRVIIKGNKRTPPLFVGREAVVTTQCLNGWYVVKTVDNAESVKLQYRSLAKVEDPQPLNLGLIGSNDRGS